MASNLLNTRIQHKVDNLSNWLSTDPILLKGELAVVNLSSDEDVRIKIGNGISAFSELPYIDDHRFSIVAGLLYSTANKLSVLNNSLSSLSTEVSSMEVRLPKSLSCEYFSGNSVLSNFSESYSTVLGWIENHDAIDVTVVDHESYYIGSEEYYHQTWKGIINRSENYDGGYGDGLRIDFNMGISWETGNINSLHMSEGYWLSSNNYASVVHTSLDFIYQVIPVTYSELVAAAENGFLIPGQQYRITDYSTVINGKYDLTQLVGQTAYLHYASSAGHDFDLIVTADSESTLNENARAVMHGGDTYFENSNLAAWKIKYTINNDPSIYGWADGTNGKGVIYYMEDEFGNSAGYDFKNIRFLRYALKLADATSDYTPVNSGLAYDSESQPNRYGSPFHVFQVLQNYLQSGSYVNPFSHSYKGTTVADYDFAGTISTAILGYVEVNSQYLETFEADWYYTFDYFFTTGETHKDASLDLNGGVKVQNNHIDLEVEPFLYFTQRNSDTYGLGGNVFELNDVNAGSCMYNVLKYFCPYNTFGDGCSSNTFGNSCYSNTFVNDCHSNTFGDNCDSNTFGNDCHSNTFGDSCYSNTFRNDCNSNTFRNDCNSNTFGYDCNYNTFGNDCDYNTFGNNCDSYTFRNNCNFNTFGNYCYSNTFGDNCNYIIFGTDSSSLKSYCRYITIENGNRYIKLNPTGTTSSSQYYQNVLIAMGVNNTTTYKMITDSNVGQTFKTTYQPANSRIVSV